MCHRRIGQREPGRRPVILELDQIADIEARRRGVAVAVGIGHLHLQRARGQRYRFVVARAAGRMRQRQILGHDQLAGRRVEREREGHRAARIGGVAPDQLIADAAEDQMRGIARALIQEDLRALSRAHAGSKAVVGNNQLVAGRAAIGAEAAARRDHQRARAGRVADGTSGDIGIDRPGRDVGEDGRDSGEAAIAGRRAEHVLRRVRVGRGLHAQASRQSPPQHRRDSVGATGMSSMMLTVKLSGTLVSAAGPPLSVTVTKPLRLMAMSSSVAGALIG